MFLVNFSGGIRRFIVSLFLSGLLFLVFSTIFVDTANAQSSGPQNPPEGSSPEVVIPVDPSEDGKDGTTILDPAASPIQVLSEGSIYFLKIDLRDSRVRIRVGLANNDVGGKQSLSSMRSRYANAGYAEWGMINGDYFGYVDGAGNPCPSNVNCAQGLTFIDGNKKDNWSAYGTTWPVRSNIGFDSSKSVQIAIGDAQSKRNMTIAGGPWVVKDGGAPVCQANFDGKTTTFSTFEQFTGDQRRYCTDTTNISMVGYSDGGQYLFIGLSASGHNVVQLGQWLKDRGAHNVIKMDGGGSGGIYYNNILQKGGGTTPIANHLAFIVDNTPPPPPEGSWTAKYYEGESGWWDPNSLNNATPKCTENLGGGLDKNYGANAPCGNGMSGDNWIGLYTATINFPSGDYVFGINHDDGFKLWLNTDNIADRGGSGDNDYVCGARHLDGTYNLKAMLREQGGDAHAKLWWTTNTSVCTPPVPNTPGNFRVTGTTTNSISLAWDNPGNLDGYHLYRLNGSGATETIGKDTTTFTDSGLASNTDYSYQLSAYNGSGDSGNTNTVTGRTGQECYSINVSSNPSGGGSVTVNTSPNCNGNQYTAGTNVQLTASPAGGYSFGSWSGDASGSSNPTNVVMNGNKNISANFNFQTPPPSANFDAWPLSGNAPFTTAMHIVDMTNISSCSWSYGDGQTSTTCSQLHDHIYNNSGSYTVSLTVDGPGGSDSMTRSNYITVTQVCYSLNVGVTPSDSGSVSKNPGPNCNGDQYITGTNVQLTASPAGSYSFGSWSGDASGLTNPTNVVMNGNKNINANFNFQTPPPSANFDAWPQTGTAPLTVAMNIVDISNISGCTWNYGDGQTSNVCTKLHNHTYNNSGSYTVSLTVDGPGGSDSMTLQNYITVTSPPGSFAKISPANIATGVSLTPTLNWETSAGATAYEYCYDTTDDNACSSWTSNGTATSKALSWLSNNTTYFWQVRAVNTDGTTYANGGTWWSFTTSAVITPPGVFAKSGPANAATGIALNPVLSWGVSSNAASYEYCYDTTNDSACNATWTSAGTSTSATLTGLSYNTTYYWQVRAVNAGGTAYANNDAAYPAPASTGTWWRFTTSAASTPPGMFAKSGPANAATGISLNPVLSWGVSSNAASYEYCYDTNNDSACNATWTGAGTGTSATLTGLSYNTTYYWQVRAVNTGGTAYANNDAAYPAPASTGTWWRFTTSAASNEWNGEYYNNRTLSGSPALSRNDSAINFEWNEGGPGGGIGNDNFSVRWTRTLNFNAGHYIFHVVADDGIRLWLDGNLIIDQWKDQGATEYTIEREVAGGNHSLKVEYYENAGGAVAKAWWEMVGSGECPTISEWQGEYYNNRGLSGIRGLCRNDSAINFDWNGGGPGGGIGTDNFSARWTRTLAFSAGYYRFHVVGDDGIRLWIDNNPIIDQWKDQGATEYIAELDLSGGNHTLKVEYYENGGGAVAKAWWELLGSSNCPTISEWKGEYYNNRALSGLPGLCRNDSAVDFTWNYDGPGGGIATDNFSARWTRTLAFSAGYYRFHVVGDDGIRMWLDDNLIIDQWKDQGPTEYTAERELVGGNHTLKVEYYENGGGAVAKAWWELLGSGTCPAISEWKGEYYNNRTLSGLPALCRNDSAVDFNWNYDGPGGGIGIDNFSARWTRTLAFSAGYYRFHVVGDDGIRMWLDDNLIIDQWKDQGATEYTAERELVGGIHTLKVEYYENSGGAVAKAWWEALGSGNCPAISAWKGEYYNNRGLSGSPALCRNDNAVDFTWNYDGPGGEIGIDNFSARWTRTLSFSAGRYIFHVVADDGIRLWLDDNLIIDQWKDQGATEYTAERELVGGNHTLKVEYYENGGGAVAKAWWERVGGGECPTISEWKGEYYNNRGLSGSPALCRNDSEIDFTWNGGGPGGGIGIDNFSARWTRTLSFNAGSYRFHVIADDGIRLWIDDSLVIDQWKDQGATEYTGDRYLSGGNHTIRVEYYENAGGAIAVVWWE